MRIRTYLWRVMVLATLMVAGAVPAAWAETTTPTSTVESSCSEYVGLTHRMAGCIRETIDSGAGVFFEKFSPWFDGAVMAVATLAVLIYGIMLAFGMVEKLGRDTFVLLLKVGAVLTFVSQGPFMLTTVTTVMDSASEAVISYTPSAGAVEHAGGDFGQVACLQSLVKQEKPKTQAALKAQQDVVPERAKLQAMIKAGDPQAAIDAQQLKVQQLEQLAATELKKVSLTSWLAIDCLIDTVIGIKIAAKAGAPTPKYDGDYFNEKLDSVDPSKNPENQSLSRGLVYLFFSGMQSSIMGVVLAVLGGFYIFGLIMLIVRAFFTYVSGYMGVAFLVIISPMIIPLVLFRDTKQYFDKWVRLLISFALQPIIMLVFIIFSITAMDLATFSGKYSLYYRIAGEKVRAAKFDMNEYLTTLRYPSSGTALGKDFMTGAYVECLPNHDCKAIINKKPKNLAFIKADNPTPPIAASKDPRQQGGFLNNQLETECTKQKMEAIPALKKACSYGYNVSVSMESIDWNLMAKARTNPAVVVPPVKAGQTAPTADAETQAGQQIAREVMGALFFCFMVVFILNGLLAVVPMIAQDLMGDLGQSPDLMGAFGGAGGGVGNIFNKISNMVGTRR